MTDRQTDRQTDRHPKPIGPNLLGWGLKITGLFHCCIVLGKKLYLNALHDVQILASQLLRVLWVYRDLANRY